MYAFKYFFAKLLNLINPLNLYQTLISSGDMLLLESQYINIFLKKLSLL